LFIIIKIREKESSFQRNAMDNLGLQYQRRSKTYLATSSSKYIHNPKNCIVREYVVPRDSFTFGDARFVSRMCSQCKKKTVGGTYTRCYTCRKAKEFEISHDCVNKVIPSAQISNIQEQVKWKRCSNTHELKARWSEFSSLRVAHLQWGYHDLLESPLEDSFRVIIHFDTHTCSVTSPGDSSDIGFFTQMQIFFEMADVANFVEKCNTDWMHK
jgi:hypothetical protein